MWLARCRSFLARHRAVRWLVVAVTTATALATVAAHVHRADAARAAWGERRTVWVAVADAAPGTAVRATAAEAPVALVPASALTGASPDGRIVHQRVAAGAILTTADLGDMATTRLPAGWRAIALDAQPVPPGLVGGEHAAIYAAGAVVADDAVVIDVEERAITLAVPIVDAAAVAASQHEAVVVWRRAGAGG